MKLLIAEYPFVFLSACLSGNWQGKEPGAVSELRVPPIRGHLRLWHRVLFHANDANRVWGSTADNEGCGSRVGVTLKNIPPPSTAKAPTLPHKDERFQGPRSALTAGTKATLVLQRLPGCTATDWEHSQKAARLWLLLGCLGNRSNRAAGSVWPDGNNTTSPAPSSPGELRHQLSDLGCNWAIALAPTSIGTSWESLRKAASDTPKDRPNYGWASPREPSPTHFKIVRFGTELRLLIFADTPTRLAAAKTAMSQKTIPALSKPDKWTTL